jgi:hypothetical protein
MLHGVLLQFLLVVTTTSASPKQAVSGGELSVCISHMLHCIAFTGSDSFVHGIREGCVCKVVYGMFVCLPVVAICGVWNVLWIVFLMLGINLPVLCGSCYFINFAKEYDCVTPHLPAANTGMEVSTPPSDV